MTDADEYKQVPNRRRGPFKRLVAYVWYCGDDWCGCTMPVIDALYVNALDQRFTWTERVWEGEFRTDHEPGAQEELDAIEAAMREFWPDAAASLFGGSASGQAPSRPSPYSPGDSK